SKFTILQESECPIEQCRLPRRESRPIRPLLQGPLGDCRLPPELRPSGQLSHFHYNGRRTVHFPVLPGRRLSPLWTRLVTPARQTLPHSQKSSPSSTQLEAAAGTRR